MTKISELNPGDYFMMDGDVCQIVYPADCTYASPTTVEVHRQRRGLSPSGEWTASITRLFETLTVPNTIEVTPGTVKFTLDFETS